jgi:hypothetical protein
MPDGGMVCGAEVRRLQIRHVYMFGESSAASLVEKRAPGIVDGDIAEGQFLHSGSQFKSPWWPPAGAGRGLSAVRSSVRAPREPPTRGHAFPHSQANQIGDWG